MNRIHLRSARRSALRSGRGGFTLAEVAVTIVIVAIGMLLVLQGLNTAKMSAAQTKTDSTQSAVTMMVVVTSSDPRRNHGSECPRLFGIEKGQHLACPKIREDGKEARRRRNRDRARLRIQTLNRTVC